MRAGNSEGSSMAQVPLKQIIDEYPFLDDRIAQEPYVYDVLREIEMTQMNGYEKGTGGFATKETMSVSRTLRIPFSITRDKNISYILELLSTKYATIIQTIVTFNFTFDDAAKKLGLREMEEYAINIPQTEYDVLVAERDETSLSNFNAFIQNFRLFNLDKVVKKARYKNDLIRVIKKGLGVEFFTYNHFVIEKGRLETIEEYCFHISNYEHVKRTLNMQQFKNINIAYNELIRTRLRKFGIMNADFGDYRDTKIDYIISILLENEASALGEKDRVEVKNFKALRDCIVQVDKTIDPAQTRSADIVKYIRENSLATAADITAHVLNGDEEIMKSWDQPDRLLAEHVVKYADQHGSSLFIDAFRLIQLFSNALANFKNIDPALPLQQREFIQSFADKLHRASKQVLRYATAQTLLGGNEQDTARLSHLVEEYDAFIKKTILQKEVQKVVQEEPKSGRPLYLRLLGFFSSIFGIFSHQPDVDANAYSYETDSQGVDIRREPRPETKDIYAKANARRARIVPLSDLIEINQENDQLIGRIIQELREHNMKIVIPVFNARSVLYPKRSGKILISDTEYLLIPPPVIKSLDTIAEYVNSLVGYKLKEEVIPGRGLVMLEKYLRVLHRQRRLSQLRKRETREKSMKH